MDVRKLLAIAALVGAGLALEAAVLHRFVAAPLASALRATRPEAATAPEGPAPRPQLTEEIEVVAPRHRERLPPNEETHTTHIAGAKRE
jgi:hypothetical protein